MLNLSPDTSADYLLLRIDPAKRDAFLTMLDLIDCAEQVPIEEQAKPHFDVLLNHLNSVAEHRQQQEEDARRLRLPKMC